MGKFLFFYLSVFVFFFASGDGRASEFDSIWKSIEERSPSLKAEEAEKEAAQLHESRSKRHWSPRLLFNAGAVSTNDPGNSLFSILGSRTLQASDLSPALLNEPSRQWFKRGAAVLDWSLFEGGAPLMAARGAAHLNESQALVLAARKREVFIETVKVFASLAALNHERSGMSELKGKLSRLVELYGVGSKDNPVGYSGLLGMRSLLNRIDSLLSQNEAESEALLQALQIQSGFERLSRNVAAGIDPAGFVREKLKTSVRTAGGTSLRVQAMQARALAQTEFSKAERARWLPRVGVYASESIVSGPRDSGNASEFGAYLRWELFNAMNLGVYREAKLRSAAMDYRSAEMADASEAARRGLRVSIPMLEENQSRIRETMAITAEQVGVTEKLFRNGSVNALQMAEVLSRRADVIEKQRQIETSLVNQLAENDLQNASVL